ncbi:glycosyltransferase family A protein [Marisediminicola sp. LYQ85]|uniref:glycosyltransferase family A protein n=1 Tax=Marisediminicola sp. LYQ85 TaxID=3391062 RepID=UPI0039836543
MVRVSVVIPVRDDAVELEHCLRALQRQTRPADEIIVVDNGSADDSAAVAVRYGARVHTEHTPGIWPAAARGFDVATGDIIARLDADSRPRRDWIERVETLLSLDPEAVAATGPGVFYQLPRFPRALADLVYMRAYFAMGLVTLGHWPLFGSSFAIRSTVWNRIRLDVHRDDSGVHDDFDLGYHLDPWSRVILDRSLAVGVSARPFGNIPSMLLRTWRAVRTIAVHGVRELPPFRWSRRVRVVRALSRRG